MSIVLLLVALLVGAVFGILQSSLQLADSVKAESDRELRVQKFVELCESTFNRLPADAVISIRPQKGFGSQQQMLEIAFALSPFDAATPGIVTLTGEADKNGLLDAAVAFEEVPLNFAPTQRQNTARPIQLPLLKGIASMQWRVFDPQTQKWVTAWNEKAVAADIVKSGQSTLTGLPPSGQNLGLNPTGVPNSPQVGLALSPGEPNAPATNPLGATPGLATSLYPRPPMLELSLSIDGEEPRHWIFWIPASVAPQ
jgi:hypothetical protein